jgi:hypothetical protein
LLALPLLRGNVYGFLDGDDATVVAGIGGVSARIGLALAAGLALASYSEVIRGPDRGVIDLHPLLPGPWLRARTALLARTRAGWLVLGWILLLPLWPRVDVLVVCAVMVAGAWVAGIGAGLGVNLAAPGLAANPALAGMFDAIRGTNPRLQAALIYAPGVALACSGVATVIASGGVTEWLEGDPVGLAALVVPFAVGGAGWWLAARNAKAMEPLPSLLGEIEAAWAAAESPEEARAVYLEWAARWAPTAIRRDLLKDLRHLWRGLRPWVTGSWGLAAIAALAGWTSDPDGLARVVWVGGAALVVAGFVGIRLGATDPAWLDLVLPSRGRVAGRAVAVWLVLQVVVLAGAGALAIRQGRIAASGLGRLEIAAVILAILGAAAGARLRGRGGIVYVPLGILLWAAGGTW